LVLRPVRPTDLREDFRDVREREAPFRHRCTREVQQERGLAFFSLCLLLVPQAAAAAVDRPVVVPLAALVRTSAVSLVLPVAARQAAPEGPEVRLVLVRLEAAVISPTFVRFGLRPGIRPVRTVRDIGSGE